MVQINTQTREVLLKIVYYGPGLSGKTTNLQKLHELVNQIQYTELFSINTMEDRTLFFDLMPFEIEALNRKIKFQVYTVPGQVHYDSTRRIILAGADGVVFVADSQKSKLQENVQSLNNLHVNLRANRLDIKTIPLVLQYNKRDLVDISSVEELENKLNFRKVPSFKAIAIEGTGVLETFEAIAIETFKNFAEKHKVVSEKELPEIILKIKNEVSKLKSYVKPKNKKIDPTDRLLKMIYQNKGGKIKDEEDILKSALNTTTKTAEKLAEVNILKNKLENKNKQLERLLKENEYMKKFLESLFQNAGVPILTFNLKGKITNWNNSAEKHFKYTVKEAKSMSFIELIPKENLLQIQNILKKVVSEKQTQNIKTTLKDRENKVLPANVVFSPITIDDNKKTVAITMIIFPE
ncbi:hypothetical protein TTHT_1215 [Thermotomaculum hydrothermale]|uniref:PAS domain-containing protein n=1 Tax=Thermotomaculum hydrothermale TaxID=981385 RepID=A0A7R6PHJ9_9BACT|nr:PAS domain S-box protein [Thermotomaculum hydrothermale]BBB32739.1 hypothetical protein TTHT_1215 [Thermotomaculum hydrothermale]